MFYALYRIELKIIKNINAFIQTDVEKFYMFL